SGGASNSRIDRCVDRLMQNAPALKAGAEAQTRRYARDTYCARFENKGWIYADGALSIEAQKWLDAGATCAVGTAARPATTVACATAAMGGTQVLDCALLHIV